MILKFREILLELQDGICSAHEQLIRAFLECSPDGVAYMLARKQQT